MAAKNTHASRAKKLTSDLMDLLEIKTKITLKDTTEGEEKALDINISSEEEAGLLIGSHGATLHAIQSFISMSLKQSTGEWVRISLDIDGWREKQDDHLKDLATQSAERTRSTGEPQHLYNLNPAQRRIIHMYLKDEEKIVTESQGEGDARYLIIKPQ